MKGYLFRAGDWVRGYCIQDEQNGKIIGKSAWGELSTIHADGASICSSGPYICNNYWPMPKRIKIFYAYANKDRDLGERLKRHLHFIKEEDIWDCNTDLSPGQEVLPEIGVHLNSANLILFLSSADFINSKYYHYIVPRAMDKYRRGEARIVPIILRPVILEGIPFADLPQLPNQKPITRWTNRDEAFVNVAIGIRQVVRELKREENSKPDYLDFYQMGLKALKKRKPYREVLQEALAAFEQAIRYDPTFSDAYHLKAIVLSKLGRPQEALVVFGQAIALDQKDAVAHYRKAMLLYELGRFTEAHIEYSHAVEIDPDIKFAYAEYENALEVSENFIKAMQTPDSDASMVISPAPSPDPLPLPSRDTNIVQMPDLDVSTIPPATPDPLPLLPAALHDVPTMPKTSPVTPDRLLLLPAVTGPVQNPRTEPLERTPNLPPSQNSSPTIARRRRWKLAILLILVLFIITGSFLIYFRVRTPNPGIVHVSPYSIPFGNITASFYANPRDSGTFDLAPSTPLDASPQSFSTITFNPDLQKEHCTALAIDTKIRQFRDITKKADGSCTVTIAHDSRGHQLGNGDRSSFEAVFIAFITVKSAGSLIISIDSDDGWILAIGKSGKYQPQADRNNIMHHPLTKKKLSAIKQYPEMGDYNIPSSSTHMIKVSFPAAGTYPVEIDYTECCGGPLVLVVTGEFTPSQS